jgi:ribose 1,5-bisphosphate isomerase
MVERLISEIAADTDSGAAEVLKRAAEVFTVPVSATADRSAVLSLCVAVVRAQPAMAPLMNLASEIVRTSDRPQSAAEVARRFVEAAENALVECSLHAGRLIHDGSIVLTHSRSSSVLAAFRQAKKDGKRFEVVATESRPRFEGRRLALELVAEGIPVTLIADAAACAIEHIDIVLVGADKVTPVDVINKIGTRMIALAARERQTTVYAVAETSKFINTEGLTPLDPPANPRELWEEAPAGIRLLNRYFEPTPLGHFTAIVTELGELEPNEAAKHASTRRLEPALLEALLDYAAGVKDRFGTMLAAQPCAD